MRALPAGDVRLGWGGSRHGTMHTQSQANRIDFNGRTEGFLAEHLGGRAEPFEESDEATATFPLKTTAYEYEAAQVMY